MAASDANETEVSGLLEKIGKPPSIMEYQKVFLGRLERYGISLTLISFGLTLLTVSFAAVVTTNQAFAISESNAFTFSLAATVLVVVGSIVAMYATRQKNRGIADALKTFSKERTDQLKAFLESAQEEGSGGTKF